MIAKGHKRRVVYRDTELYFFVRESADEKAMIRIMSDDKSINLTYPLSDKDICAKGKTLKEYVIQLLEEYFD